MSFVKFPLLPVALMIGIAACKKNNSSTPPAILHPTVTTRAATNITSTGATVGGTIQDNGGATITASGVCWSSTNTQPVITDNIVSSTATEGSFSVNITNLSSNTTYYARAFATNSAGTAYGTVATFITSILNTPSEARNITVFGAIGVAERIVVRYRYFDAENNPENGTTFQWYVQP